MTKQIVGILAASAPCRIGKRGTRESWPQSWTSHLNWAAHADAAVDARQRSGLQPQLMGGCLCAVFIFGSAVDPMTHDVPTASLQTQGRVSARACSEKVVCVSCLA